MNSIPAFIPASPARVEISYPLPDVLEGLLDPTDYRKWLHAKAVAHVRRDSERWGRRLSISTYKQAIHRAVCEHDGTDPYTGERLQWELSGTYDNTQSKAGGSTYKRGFRLLPTIDHENNAPAEAPLFRVLSWETNDAKNDMSPEAFIDLCKRVASRAQPL
ncbi:hypothetical protein OKA05_08065 [Luteolibacter arcticus]|uniref:Uncharacterized protein n=1 Tax=Luteolibacter arcticus TaxID=1581411 RepID=A0ABT3GFX1_9BACT|nr:hypothetical protein [Luteolibacter arcticus]MCW1922507.1 hypothetical protein [Luteolibacter arcticus]